MKPCSFLAVPGDSGWKAASRGVGWATRRELVAAPGVPPRRQREGGLSPQTERSRRCSGSLPSSRAQQPVTLFVPPLTCSPASLPGFSHRATGTVADAGVGSTARHTAGSLKRPTVVPSHLPCWKVVKCCRKPEERESQVRRLGGRREQTAVLGRAPGVDLGKMAHRQTLGSKILCLEDRLRWKGQPTSAKALR